MLKYVRLISFIIIYSMIAFCGCEYNDKKVSFQIGEYINFGSYLNETIVWECVEVDAGQAVFISKYVLCRKAFDAAEGGTAIYIGAPPPANSDYKISSQILGSNIWANSNIREWLNSKSVTVNFSTHPPIASAVIDSDIYVNERGFLNSFSDIEINQIIPTEHDNVKDYVYLLSVDEINKYLEMNIKMKKMISKSAGNKLGINQIQYSYWTRTPSNVEYKAQVYYGESEPIIDFSGEFCALGKGILPVINIKSPIEILSGNGSLEQPYTMH
jgi:hypothetical protein